MEPRGIAIFILRAADYVGKHDRRKLGNAALATTVRNLEINLTSAHIARVASRIVLHVT